MTDKRKKIEKLVLDTMKGIDKSNLNHDYYKKKFDSMSDTQFNKYIKKMINDDDEFFRMQLIPFKNEPKFDDIDKTAKKVLGIELEEYIYYKDSETGKTVRSQTKAQVGFLPIKRLQQMVFKKNSYPTDHPTFNPKTGQLADSSKTARVTDLENIALNVMNADSALQELMGARADNRYMSNEMYKEISDQGYTNIKKRTNVEQSQTMNTLHSFFLAAGIVTDMVIDIDDLKLPRTIKNRK